MYLFNDQSNWIITKCQNIILLLCNYKTEIIVTFTLWRVGSAELFIQSLRIFFKFIKRTPEPLLRMVSIQYISNN